MSRLPAKEEFYEDVPAKRRTPSDFWYYPFREIFVIRRMDELSSRFKIASGDVDLMRMSAEPDVFSEFNELEREYRKFYSPTGVWTLMNKSSNEPS